MAAVAKPNDSHQYKGLRSDSHIIMFPRHQIRWNSGNLVHSQTPHSLVATLPLPQPGPTQIACMGDRDWFRQKCGCRKTLEKKSVGQSVAEDQNTGNKWTPIYYNYNPCKWCCQKSPLKMFLKTKTKNPRQGRPVWYTVAEFQQNRWEVFYYQQINKWSLISHACTGLKTQIPMHPNSIGCPKIVPPLPTHTHFAPVFYWL